MRIILDFIKNNKYNLFLVITWLIITIITMLHHELWRDEAQVWCLVRDLDIVSLIKAIQVEGHPYLWYLLNLPFAKMGCSVLAMQIIGLFFVFLAVLLVVFKSSFGKVMKFLIIFNAGMLYLLPIVVRNYALIPFFMFYIAHIYHDRHSKPYLYLFLIFCLSQTHSLMLCFVLVLLSLFTYEAVKEKKLKLTKYFIFTIVLSFLNLIGLLIFYFLNFSQNNIVISCVNYYRTLPLIELVSKYAFSFFTQYIIELFGELQYIIPISFYIILFSLIYLFIKAEKKVSIIFICNFLYFLSIYIWVWAGGIPLQKTVLFILLLIFCIWILKKNKFINTCVLEIFLFLILILYSSYSIFFIKNEYLHNFSGGKEIASYIMENLSKENHFFFKGSSFLITPISVYLPNIKIYNIDEKKEVSFFNFDVKSENQSFYIPEKVNYIITQNDYKLDKEPFLTSEMNFYNDTYSQEIYSLYKFDNDEILKQEY